jgi:tetratricopeptide (TPR) repeat protein
MEQLAAASDDPLLLAEVTEIIRMTDYREGLPRSVDLLRAYADAHPDALYQRLQVAHLCYLARSHDPEYLREAYEAANVVINAEPVPVSTLSRIQNPLQIRAAGLIVDVEYRRWINAEEADKAARLKDIEAARDALALLVAEPEKDVTYIRAEGKIAAARNDFRTAVDRFELALELATTEDFETLWNAARCLAAIGQDGKAWERIERAYRLRPTNIAVLMEKARLEYKIGRFEDALASAQTVLAMDPTNVGAMRIVQVIATQESRVGRAPELGGTAGPLIQAREELEGGEIDAARRTLVTAMEQADDKLPFLSELIQLELSASRTEEAMAYLDQALEIEPNNQVLRRYKISLSAENQVEAVKQFVEEAYPNEADRAVHSVVQLRLLAEKLDENAERQIALGELETAELTSARADEAREDAEQFLVRALELSPDHPSLIAHLFNATLIQLQQLADEKERIAEGRAAPRDGESAEQAMARLDAAREKAEQALVELAERARIADTDQTGGLIYRGRLELYQEDYERAVLTLTDATIRKSWSALAWRLLGCRPTKRPTRATPTISSRCARTSACSCSPVIRPAPCESCETCSDQAPGTTNSGRSSFSSRPASVTSPWPSTSGAGSTSRILKIDPMP